MWGWVLKAALAVGLDKWAKKKAVQLAAKLKSRAVKKADAVLAAAGAQLPATGTIIVREDKDIHRPGQVVVRDDRTYRVVKLLMVNKLGAFYEAVAE